jgi:hypothetical protein
MIEAKLCHVFQHHEAFLGPRVSHQRTEHGRFTRAGRARNQESLAVHDSINKARNNLGGILYRQLIKPRCVVALDAD